MCSFNIEQCNAKVFHKAHNYFLYHGSPKRNIPFTTSRYKTIKTSGYLWTFFFFNSYRVHSRIQCATPKGGWLIIIQWTQPHQHHSGSAKNNLSCCKSLLTNHALLLGFPFPFITSMQMVSPCSPFNTNPIFLFFSRKPSTWVTLENSTQLPMAWFTLLGHVCSQQCHVRFSNQSQFYRSLSQKTILLHAKSLRFSKNADLC